jgi:NADP-dependent 3-hydroxy acid dehydrogenase YdfG
MRSSVELTGRRVLLAGASGGIGLAVARRLSAAGARLHLVARRADRLEAAAREVGGAALAGDVSDAEFVEALRGRVEADGPLDVLIHAAGGFDLAPVAETDPSMFRTMVDTNLVGPFLLMRAFLPGMLGARAGHIVTVGSVAGRVAFPGNGAYSASKFGVRGLHAVLAEELRGTGVRCTLVEPAATDTSIWDPLDPDSRSDLPSRSAMLPADAVADAVLYSITRPPEVQIPTVAVQRS